MPTVMTVSTSEPHVSNSTGSPIEGRSTRTSAEYTPTGTVPEAPGVEHKTLKPVRWFAAVTVPKMLPEKPLSKAEVGYWQICGTVCVIDGLMVVAVAVPV